MVPRPDAGCEWGKSGTRGKESPVDTMMQTADLLYGVRAIGEVLGLTEDQTDHLIRAGRIPAFKLGKRWCSRRSRLVEWLDEQMPAA